MTKDARFKKLLEAQKDPFSGEDDKQKNIQFWQQLCFPNAFSKEPATKENSHG